MTIVAGLFVAVFGRLLGHWRSALANLLVGASASVIRAAIMCGLALSAR